jgi:hypothetical protein
VKEALAGQSLDLESLKKTCEWVITSIATEDFAIEINMLLSITVVDLFKQFGLLS